MIFPGDQERTTASIEERTRTPRGCWPHIGGGYGNHKALECAATLVKSLIWNSSSYHRHCIELKSVLLALFKRHVFCVFHLEVYIVFASRWRYVGGDKK